ncbi:MAG TPA: DsrE family protein [Chryseolinea sp.]|nr:DsrE family protein [Chryseolinea sp.]HPM32855.1 DsrE family protein [Chryseolinea sp.]
MKKIFAFAVLCCTATMSFAQQNSDMIDMKKHHIVLQFSDGDSESQASVTAQVKNILNAWPNAEIEVVCHGPGLDLLTTAGSKSSSALKELAAKGVIFSACNNTMRKRNLKKEDLLSEVRIVPSAMVQLATRQEEGWAYMKGGH